MAKYSDHSTIGGQVLAHRIRMMKQNANIIFIAGKIGFLLCFVIYFFLNYSIYDLWNYFCILKADLSRNWSFFDGSYITDEAWNFTYMRDFVIQKLPDTAYAKVEMKAFFLKDLWISGIFAVLVMIGVGVIHKRLGKKLTDKKEIISGHDYVEGKDLKKLIKEKSDITLANIPYPKGAEARHTLITGTTGSGKTNAIIELIDQIQEKGDRAIIVDTVGTYVNRYYNKERGDIILNPLDPRSVPWSFLEECKDQEILRNVAACILEKGDNHDKFWEDAAKIVFSETAMKIQAENKSLKEFLDILAKEDLSETQKYLEGSYGASLVDKSADKMAVSIRATLINSVYPFEVLREEKGKNFSIRNWIKMEEKGFLFLSCTPKERNTVIPLITSWLSIASDTLMQCPETDKRTWFFIDELHNLRKLPKLDLALAEIRKFGGCYVMGTQLIAQLEKIYGKELTRAITGLCGTKVVMNVPEPITAKYMADFLGEKEEITSTETLSYGANTIRDGANISQRYTKESVVPASQIMDLTTGEAFVRFYGIPTVGKIKFKYHERKNLSNKNSKIKLDKDEKIIDVSEKTEKETSNIINYLRSKYAHAIIIEKGNEITKRFAENTDIILDPINGPYSWDIIEEFRRDYIPLVRLIISDLDTSLKKKLELSILKELNYYTSENEALNTIITQYKSLMYLENLVNEYQKVTLSRYTKGNGNILMFVPYNENPDLIKITNMFKTLAKNMDVYIIEDNETYSSVK